MNLLRIASRVASKPLLFVDLDETLVHSKPSSMKDEDFPAEGIESLELHNYITVLRPGVRGFLDSLMAIGDLFLCTAASRSYATEILEGFGLGAYFKDIYSRENVFSDKSLGNAGEFVLIDNLPSSAPDISSKLQFIGLSPFPSPTDVPEGADDREHVENYKQHRDAYYREHHVEVPAFTGSPADSALQSVLSNVRATLSKTG